jgi:hypothetical protein
VAVGLFPKVPSRLDRVQRSKEMVVLWARRVLDWKRIDLLLKATARALN